MKKTIAFLLVSCMLISLAACGGGGAAATTAPHDSESARAPVEDTAAASTAVSSDLKGEAYAEQTAVQMIIDQAQKMSMEELAAKAIAESIDGHFTAISDDETVKAAMDKFVQYLTTLNSHYNLTYEWEISTEDRILAQTAADSVMEQGKWSAVLVSDGLQTHQKMKDRAMLDVFIPGKWIEDNGYFVGDYSGYLPVLTKVEALAFNCTGKDTFNTCWDFVADGIKPFEMPAVYEDSFLMMLTRADYAAHIRESFAYLSSEQKALFQPVVEEMAPLAQAMGLSEDGAYALAWLKLWTAKSQPCSSTEEIMNLLTSRNGEGQCGMVDYTAIGTSFQNTNNSASNMKVAAYEPVYNGFGGYAHSEYAFVADNATMPWTACAFIAYITTTQDGFSAWGRSPGVYSGNSVLAAETMSVFGHDKGGYSGNGADVLYPVKNDKGIEWWRSFGKVVTEDFEYIDSVTFTIGSWLKTLPKGE